MKRKAWRNVLALALTGVLALGLTACGSSDSKTADAGSAAAADGKTNEIKPEKDQKIVDTVAYENLTFTALEVDERRIEKIKVERHND